MVLAMQPEVVIQLLEIATQSLILRLQLRYFFLHLLNLFLLLLLLNLSLLVSVVQGIELDCAHTIPIDYQI